MNPYATYVPNMHNSVTGYTGGIPTDYYSADPQRMVCVYKLVFRFERLTLVIN